MTSCSQTRDNKENKQWLWLVLDAETLFGCWHSDQHTGCEAASRPLMCYVAYTDFWVAYWSCATEQAAWSRHLEAY